MIYRHVIEYLNQTFKDICISNDLFGGDFRQVTPVVKSFSLFQKYNSVLKKSPLWQYIKILNLTINN